MADIAAARSNLKEEELNYKRPVSESTWNKIGGSINFINTRQYDTKKFQVNGGYGIGTGSFLTMDGYFIFPFDAEIFEIGVFNDIAGSSGITAFDVKKGSGVSGAMSSIFSTTPKIASTAGSAVRYLSTSTGTGYTQPVTTVAFPIPVSAGDAIKADLITRQSAASGCGILVYHRPR